MHETVRPHALLCVFALLTRAPAGVEAIVINRIYGPNHTELSHLSVGGGAHLYISGVELGTPFSPPAIRIGINGNTACEVQGFTSTRNRLHCIIQPGGLLPPSEEYDPNGDEGTHGEATALIQNVPLFIVGPRGEHADCWHVGGLNHGWCHTHALTAPPLPQPHALAESLLLFCA